MRPFFSLNGAGLLDPKIVGISILVVKNDCFACTWATGLFIGLRFRFAQKHFLGEVWSSSSQEPCRGKKKIVGAPIPYVACDHTPEFQGLPCYHGLACGDELLPEQLVAQEKLSAAFSGPSIARVCAIRKHRHYNGSRHYSAYCHYWLFASVSSYFTGTIAGNRQYRATCAV